MTYQQKLFVSFIWSSILAFIKLLNILKALTQPIFELQIFSHVRNLSKFPWILIGTVIIDPRMAQCDMWRQFQWKIIFWLIVPPASPLFTVCILRGFVHLWYMLWLKNEKFHLWKSELVKRFLGSVRLGYSPISWNTEFVLLTPRGKCKLLWYLLD